MRLRHDACGPHVRIPRSGAEIRVPTTGRITVTYAIGDEFCPPTDDWVPLTIIRDDDANDGEAVTIA